LRVCVCVCWTTTHFEATTFCVCVCVTGHVLPTIVADFLTYGWKHRILNFRNGLWKHRKQKRRPKAIENILRLIKTIKFDVFTFKNFSAWKRQKRVQIFEILHFQKRQIWQFDSVNFMKILQKQIRRFLNSTILPSPILARVFKNRFLRVCVSLLSYNFLQATTFCVCVCVVTDFVTSTNFGV
jgi:hypothetical protein